MENKENNHKIILVCNKHGIVKQIFLDTLSLFDDVSLPVGLHSLVSPTSIKELGVFWLSIHEKIMEQNTVLTLSFKSKSHNYIFSGYLLEETVLLCGNTELTSTEIALEEIMLINNEQANQIRLTEKKADNFRKVVDKLEVNEAFLNDFSSLNNELVNSKRELMRKNQKIELLNKELNAVNENMTMFTYSVSHDLKEPVRMVKSFLALIHKKYGASLDQKGQTYIDMALDGANRLSKMMADLLEYHQSSNFGAMESVNLNVVLSEVKQILHKEIEEKGARITSSNLPTINGSATGLLQIFQNLVSNAVKFSLEWQTPIVTIHTGESDTHFTFRIKDNGIGIAKDQIHEVFNLFKRLNAPYKYEGSGMGLAMVRKSIERMGGEVWMESELGKGSTVCFTIAKSMDS